MLISDDYWATHKVMECPRRPPPETVADIRLSTSHPRAEILVSVCVILSVSPCQCPQEAVVRTLDIVQNEDGLIGPYRRQMWSNISGSRSTARVRDTSALSSCVPSATQDLGMYADCGSGVAHVCRRGRQILRLSRSFPRQPAIRDVFCWHYCLRHCWVAGLHQTLLCAFQYSETLCGCPDDAENHTRRCSM
jgi:hypothetical protein